MYLNSIFDKARSRFSEQVDYWDIRLVDRQSESIKLVRGVVEPLGLGMDKGLMVSVFSKGGFAYAATGGLDFSSIERAFEKAKFLAERFSKSLVQGIDPKIFSKSIGHYASKNTRAWIDESLEYKLDLLRSACDALKIDHRVVDWQAGLNHCHQRVELISSLGSQIEQDIFFLCPSLSVTAFDKGEAQRRSFGGNAYCRQGGLEVLDELSFLSAPKQVAEEAIELVYADNCPTFCGDLLLASDQMVLQIHESIGHPLELDRILGDERNYAGTSFVTQQMFGNYQYGSKLLNISFDPTQEGEFASYAFDDEATPAVKQYLIKDGLLIRPLGGALSSNRAGLSGVANARAVGWNRPPIDRMANLNLEPGDESLEQMIARVEKGIYMKTNASWSIDDSRNKFQFGCEWAQLIENGKLTQVVKNPNYRGVSSSFWRNLIGVGNQDSFEIMGTPYCGKGEPNQAIEVGHASPSCLFKDVEIFGGEG